MKKIVSFNWSSLFNVLAGALILSYPALLNRFPIVTSDTGTYILTALEHVFPFDRPIYYGYFINATAIYQSLWFVVYIQNILLTLLIWKTIKFFSPSFSVAGFFLCIISLTAFTTMAWFSCQIMTDVFTPLLLMSLSLLLIKRNMAIAETFFLLVVFFYSCLVHYSHFLLAASVLVVIAMFKITGTVRYFQQVKPGKMILTGSTILSAILFISTHNYLAEGKFHLSKGSAILLTSKMVENGLLKKYLDRHCHEDPSPLCAYKDRLPVWGPEFLYGNESAINIMGLEKAEAECQRMNQRIILTYPFPFLLQAVKGGAINLFRIEAGTGIMRYDENSAPYQPIKKVAPTEFNQWITSRQEENQLQFQLLTILQKIFIYCSLIILLFNLFNKTLSAGWNDSLVSFAQVILLALILNALITGALASEHDDRYQSRIAWLIPLIVLMQYQGLIVSRLVSFFKNMSNPR